MVKHSKISICIPIHNMQNADFFLRRLMQSLEIQTFRDFEIVITKEGKMAQNTNAAIKKCKGEIIKILYMDDLFYDSQALEKIVSEFEQGANWVVTGCIHVTKDGQTVNPHLAKWEGINKGINTIGSPSVMAFINAGDVFFDENLSWVLDTDLYIRLGEKWGMPNFIDEYLIGIGIGSHQMTNILSDEYKQQEYEYLQKKQGIIR